jgi:hypothetical protein
MKQNYGQIVVLALLPLVLRTILYLFAFKIRSIHIKLLSCIIIAGAATLVGVVPLLPYLVGRVLALGLAMFLITRYTEAELYPDVIFIPLVVELLSGFLTDEVIAPVLQ